MTQFREHRVLLGIPLIGVLGLVFCGYILLYNLDVIQWRVTQKTDELTLEDKRVVALLVVLGAGACYLVALGRVKVRVSDEGVHYRGILRSKYIRWDEVSKVARGARATSVNLWSKRQRIALPELFSHQDELNGAIFKYVRANAPNAEIDERSGLLRRWRKRKPEEQRR